MCKLAGAFLVITGAGIAGTSYAYRLKKRLDNLKELEHIVINIENDIRYRHSIISSAFKNVSTKCHKPFSHWLMFISKRLDYADDPNEANEQLINDFDCDDEFFNGFFHNTYEFSEIWDKSLIYLKDNSFLKNEDIDDLKTLGQTLGYLDITSQKMGISLFLDNLHSKINEINSTLNDKIRISIIAGMVSGIFIVILLI
ncbi:MAG: stage III sporulation protein AB [Lachnospiraceae bacterium]|nr:stage III sporulation protein AB [Lachnospiraceae bacterium]MBQ9610248.1 stage III sporulation protein AB [Lachnospiraceae bacterium]